MADVVWSRRGLRSVIYEGSLAQLFAVVVGVIFVLVGILGFIPGITTDYGEMALAGPDSEAALFGLFHISVLHNAVHLLFGALGIALAANHVWARSYLVIGGLIYLGLSAYGAVIDRSSDANFLPVNEADNGLHLGLGIGLVALGAVAWRDRRRSPRR